MSFDPVVKTESVTYQNGVPLTQTSPGNYYLRFRSSPLTASDKQMIKASFYENIIYLKEKDPDLNMADRLRSSLRTIDWFCNKSSESQILGDNWDNDVEALENIACQLTGEINRSLIKRIEEIKIFKVENRRFDWHFDMAARNIIRVYEDLFEHNLSTNNLISAMRILSQLEYSPKNTLFCETLATKFSQQGKVDEMFAVLSSTKTLSEVSIKLIGNFPALTLYEFFSTTSVPVKTAILTTLINRGLFQEAIAFLSDPHLGYPVSDTIYRQIINKVWESKDINLLLFYINGLYHSSRQPEYDRIIDYCWKSFDIASILTIISHLHYYTQKDKELTRVIDYYLSEIQSSTQKDALIFKARNVIDLIHDDGVKSKQFRRLIDECYKVDLLEKIPMIIHFIPWSNERTPEYIRLISMYPEVRDFSEALIKTIPLLTQVKGSENWTSIVHTLIKKCVAHLHFIDASKIAKQHLAGAEKEDNMAYIANQAIEAGDFESAEKVLTLCDPIQRVIVESKLKTQKSLLGKTL